VNSITGTNPDEVPAMTGSTSAPPCCTLDDCSDPDAVCFLGHCTNEPPGPCEDGTCNEGKGCAQNLQAHCDGCSDYSGCVQPSVCELINGEPCTLGPIATDAQASDPVDGSLDGGLRCTAPPELEGPGGGFAEQTGCHLTSYMPSDCVGYFGLERLACPASGSDASLPEDLPCGTCGDADSLCALSVHARCDCDGDGPRPPFIDPNYWDEWGCLCIEGIWQCWILTISGASCALCADDDAGP
jgi:hypothetical protein